jgi:hypothetical protein
MHKCNFCGNLVDGTNGSYGLCHNCTGALLKIARQLQKAKKNNNYHTAYRITTRMMDGMVDKNLES